MDMKKLNKKGFTLIELLAAMVILAAIMAIAVPNIMGILNNSKANAYVEDAKKLLSLAEYEFRGDPTKSPTPGNCVVMNLSYLDNSEFENAPNNGSYDKDNSYVMIVNVGTVGKNKYKYYVTLDEKISGGTHRGVAFKSYEELYSDKSTNLIKNSASALATASSKRSSAGCTTIIKTYSSADLG